MEQEIIPVTIPVKRGPDITVSSDEEYLRVKFDKIPSLKPSFAKDGNINEFLSTFFSTLFYSS